MKIVTFYTPEYALEVEDFVKACVTHGHTPHVQAIRSQGSWRDNCGLKPSFLLDMMAKYDEGLLWLDIDARLRMSPAIVTPGSADFGAFFIPNRVMHAKHIPGGPKSGHDGISSGTMWWSGSVESVDFCHRWLDAEHGQGHWEQQILGDVWYKTPPPRTWRMPQEWYKVFDCRWFEKSHGEPIVEHFQASRRLKRNASRHQTDEQRLRERQAPCAPDRAPAATG